MPQIDVSSGTTVKTAKVDIKSAWLSKINWTQAVSMTAMLLTFFGVTLPPETQSAILAGIVATTSVVTWVQRTFFTTTVVESSLSPPPLRGGG